MLIDHYYTQTKDIILSSTSESFGGLSLENISYRTSTSIDNRTYSLNTDIKDRFVESIKRNLELDDSLTAKPLSYVSNREPIKFRELKIIDKDMLPYQFNDTSIVEESLLVVIELPIELTIVKSSKWIRISQIVSLESFLTSKEVAN